MRYPIALVLLTGFSSSALADTFRLECIDSNDGNTRLALIEINTAAASIQIYSEASHDWKTAVNVSIADSTISYVEHEFDEASPGVSVTINRATGKYFAYSGNSPRKEGQCKKVAR